MNISVHEIAIGGVKNLVFEQSIEDYMESSRIMPPLWRILQQQTPATAGKRRLTVLLPARQVNLATPVVALGFPLGQKTAKLTTGVISGHEKVAQHITKIY